MKFDSTWPESHCYDCIITFVSSNCNGCWFDMLTSTDSGFDHQTCDCSHQNCALISKHGMNIGSLKLVSIFFHQNCKHVTFKFTPMNPHVLPGLAPQIQWVKRGKSRTEDLQQLVLPTSLCASMREGKQTRLDGGMTRVSYGKPLSD